MKFPIDAKITARYRKKDTKKAEPANHLFFGNLPVPLLF